MLLDEGNSQSYEHDIHVNSMHCLDSPLHWKWKVLLKTRGLNPSYNCPKSNCRHYHPSVIVNHFFDFDVTDHGR